MKNQLHIGFVKIQFLIVAFGLCGEKAGYSNHHCFSEFLFSRCCLGLRKVMVENTQKRDPGNTVKINSEKDTKLITSG
jgi:hypothetical protein